MKEMIILTDLDYCLCFATVKYNEMYGMNPQQNLEREIIIARDWDKMLDIDEEDIFKAVKEKFNSARIEIYEIDVKYTIDDMPFVNEIDCMKFYN